jgi:hypothetical protein
MKLYTGSAWVAAYVTGGGFLASANNLSDLADAGSARTNLGLGTAATTAATDYVAVTGDSMTGDLSFGDNDKAIFGAGSDLQIYHDGTSSFIRDVGTGDLRLRGTNVRIESDSSHDIFVGEAGGAATIYHNNSPKLATTATGIDVTGTVTMDGAVVDGRAYGTVTTDNDLSFDMSATNNFSCTPTGTGTLTFTNITAGQSGNIWMDNSGGYAISAASTTYISAADLTTVSTAGVYRLSYFSNGTNVAVSVSQALTSAGA